MKTKEKNPLRKPAPPTKGAIHGSNQGGKGSVGVVGGKDYHYVQPRRPAEVCDDNCRFGTSSKDH